MNNFYVYSYTEPGIEEPFYIGKGSGNRATHGHLEGTTLIANKLRKLKRGGIEPVIDYLQVDLTEQEAFQIEEQLIKYWGRIDLDTGCLCNHTNGGEGESGCPCSEEKKAKISASNKLSQIGREHSLDSRIKRAKSRTEEQKVKITEGAIKARGRRICSVNYKGQVVRIFESIGEAARCGYSLGGIASVLNGTRLSHQSYFWRDAKETDVPLLVN